MRFHIECTRLANERTKTDRRAIVERASQSVLERLRRALKM
jgi:hypothetical protein